MKKLNLWIFLLIVFVSSCVTKDQLGETVLVPSTSLPTNTQTLTIAAPLTPTCQPSNTPIPTRTLWPTETSTISPTIIPTFDAAGIITHTTAPPAQCPPEIPDLTTDLSSLFNWRDWNLDEQSILDFLNAGGTPQAIISTFLQETGWFEEDLAIQQDITGDNVS